MTSSKNVTRTLLALVVNFLYNIKMISLKKNYLAIAFAIFLVGSVSYYIYNDLNNGSSDNSKDNTVTIGQPGITLDVGSPTGNYKI